MPALVAVGAMLAVGTLFGLRVGPAEARPEHATDYQSAGCARPWRLRLGGAPDAVGPGGYQCAGCDKVTTDGDRMAIRTRLEGASLTVRASDGAVLHQGPIPEAAAGASHHEVHLSFCTAPPYEITLEIAPDGYFLCPNSPQVVVVTQSYFDRESGARPGRGRSAAYRWYYWNCDADGEVICVIKCWLEAVIPGATPAPCESEPCSVSGPRR